MTAPARHRPPAKSAPIAVPGRAVGAKSVLRALGQLAPGATGRLDPHTRPRVLVALDAPVGLTGPVRAEAAARSLPVIEVRTAAELGVRLAVGRPVAAALEPAQNGPTLKDIR